MGRSFYVPTKSNEIERYSTGNTLENPASRMRYEMEERNGNFFQRRTAIGAEGSPTRHWMSESTTLLARETRRGPICTALPPGGWWNCQ